MSDVVAVFSDGGVIQVNPSKLGGTWATCHVNLDGVRVWDASGYVRPGDVGSKVTNNQTEFFALLMGLEALPAGWSGIACSDSQVTLGRFFGSYRGMKGIPAEWNRRMYAVLTRLGDVRPMLLSGHPTKAQLAAGVGRNGYPVSEHNVWCDKQCTEWARTYQRERVAS